MTFITFAGQPEKTIRHPRWNIFSFSSFQFVDLFLSPKEFKYFWMDGISLLNFSLRILCVFHHWAAVST